MDVDGSRVGVLTIPAGATIEGGVRGFCEAHALEEAVWGAILVSAAVTEAGKAGAKDGGGGAAAGDAGSSDGGLEDELNEMFEGLAGDDPLTPTDTRDEGAAAAAASADPPAAPAFPGAAEGFQTSSQQAKTEA